MEVIDNLDVARLPLVFAVVAADDGRRSAVVAAALLVALEQEGRGDDGFSLMSRKKVAVTRQMTQVIVVVAIVSRHLLFLGGSKINGNDKKASFPSRQVVENRHHYNCRKISVILCLYTNRR